MSQTLWAKKPWKNHHTPTVAKHCNDVLETGEAIFSNIGSDLAESLGVDSRTLQEYKNLFLASTILHDIAKINSSFQEMLLAIPGEPKRQPVRHEILGAWLLMDPDFFGNWFKDLRCEKDIWSIIWAIAGHHLKMGDPARGATLFRTDSGVKQVSIPLSQSEACRLLLTAATLLGSDSEPPEVLDTDFDTTDDDDEGLEQRIAHFAECSCRVWNRLRRDPEVVQQTAILKALLIAADVAGSALTSNEERPAQWVPQQLDSRITEESLQTIIESGSKGKPLLPFQKTVGESQASATIVIAGCGNGKTTAAYLWAQRHAKGRKLWFTYPTTGTTSAGYQGYLHDHPDLKSHLIHMRSKVDLQAIQGNDKNDEDEEWLRLESLRAWGCQAIACTVDTVLGLLQNQRRPLFSFPAIAAGAIVFDEIHSYDTRLFGSLLRFLKVFPGVPVLLMSASIPPRRMEAIREVLGDRVEEVIQGDANLESYKRYQLKPRESAEECRAEVTNALKAGKKVLWVCNTVGDAIRESQSARDWAKIPDDKIIVYHSRFRYQDRVERQQQVLTEFEYHFDGPLKGQRKKPGPAIVFSTQVCEMSLDASSDIMVTSECPLPSLLQRLGRLNRFASGDDPWPCLVYPFQGDPYNEQAELIQTRGDFRVSMAAARKAVHELADQPCSQEDLSKRLDEMFDNEEFEEYSAWIDGGWLTEPSQLRDANGGITLIRREDLSEIEKELGPENARPSKWTAANLVPWTIPMLYRRGIQFEKRIGGYPVAPEGTVNYCEKEGATWAKKDQK